MTGRLATRAADVEALLARYNDTSASAIEALARGDAEALTRVLDVRDALQHEIERASREVLVARARFTNATRAYGASRVVDQALDRYCAPLEELTRVAQQLQRRLELDASELRHRLLAELAQIETSAGAARGYASAAVGELHLPREHRLDVTL